MRKMKFFLLAVAAMAAVSCAKELAPETNDTPKVELVPMTFTANADDGSETKVFYDGETKTTQWKVGDEIAVISSTGTVTTFTATSVSNGGMTATFEGLTENAETYYAVSPASAYKGNGEEVLNGTLYVNIPEVQTAVAGTFDPEAFVSVASNKGSTLNFKNSCAVIKFSLNNVEGVKSVRFTANNVPNLAGTQNVSTSNIPTHSWGTTFEGRTSYNMITLNAPAEGFAAETDYYMTMRPQTMSNGINLYVEYASDVKVRKGASEFPASVNTIRDLKALDAVALTDVTPYESYNLGFDVMVAGKAINKATYGDATLISEDTELTSVEKIVNFIDSDATVSLAKANYSNLILIGNNPDVKTKVNVTGNVRWTQNAVFALKNLSIVDNSDNATMFQSNSTGGNVYFDACKITTPKNSQYFYIGHQINTFKIHNCDIEVSEDNKMLVNCKESINSVEFKNNIFYSPEGDHTGFKFIANSPTITDMSFSNNTIANIYASTTSNAEFMVLKAVTNYTCDNNLFYLPNFKDERYSWIIKVVPTTTVSSENNILYKTVSTYNRMRYQLEQTDNAAYFPSTNVSTKVVTNVDLANGIIVPADVYGATR